VFFGERAMRNGKTRIGNMKERGRGEDGVNMAKSKEMITNDGHFHVAH